MTDSISRISDLPSATSGGTGSAKDMRVTRRFRHETDHDTVTISAEARRRFSTNDADWDSSEEE
ncbi:MAG: hypothetical protein AB9919_09645 [Geobacteraceae bacterium]